MNGEVIVLAKEYVNKLLWHMDDHYYHHYNHALEVMNRAIYLWEKEWVSKEEVELLWLAWLFHDTWFVVKYDNNEWIWAKVASNYLKTINYPKDKIETVERLILSTSPKYKTPKDILERVIKDADLDNFWRLDFFEKWEKLKKELEVVKKIKIKDPDWHHSSLDLLFEHHFYTDTQKIERLEQKILNEKKLKSLMIDLKECNDWIDIEKYL